MKTAQEIVQDLGGVCETARLLGIRAPSVSRWMRENAIPDDKLIRLAVICERRGIATRKELLPELWAQVWPELIRKPRTTQ